MYERRGNAKHLGRFRENLDALARREPLDAAHHVDLYVNGTHDRLRLLMQRSRLYPLQAVRVAGDGRDAELITRPRLLAALTELVVAQCGGEGAEGA